MTEAWKTWEGQTVDGFLLHQYLGGSDHSAVYLTQLNTFPQQNVAIKFIPADAAADAQLARWRVAGQLSHPNLLRLVRVGRCQVANNDVLYVVMEYAEEALSQILPERTLEPAEARQMLQSVLDALTYLHGQGLAHTRIKPGNVLASGDQLKVSSDTLCEIGSAPLVKTPSTIYSAPESEGAPISAAADVWGLGVTVVEALTQRTPVVRSQTRTEFPVPETIAPPFLEIARRSVQADASKRASLQEISSLLNPGAAVKREPKRDPNLLPATEHVTPAEPIKKSLAAQQATLVPRAMTGASEAVVVEPRRKSHVTITVLAVIFILMAILLAPRMLNRFSQLQPHADTVQPSIAPASDVLDSPDKKNQQSMDKTINALKQPPAGVVSNSLNKPASAAVEPREVKPARTEKHNPGRGAVVYQVVPDVSQRARETILGTVRVNVRVHVDANGNVSSAELGNNANKYFGDQAVEVSRRWTFTPPQVNGSNAASEWVLRFEFSPTTTKVFPTQTKP
ncbi:MAG TPA: TonB family protein [Candidatus Acidoferrum sp.]|jgi:TonB family protein